MAMDIETLAAQMRAMGADLGAKMERLLGAVVSLQERVALQGRILERLEGKTDELVGTASELRSRVGSLEAAIGTSFIGKSEAFARMDALAARLATLEKRMDLRDG